MKHLILILLLLTSTAFTQSWTSVIETDMDVSDALNQSVDLFANGDGLHIIYQESNSLKYCKLDVDGDKDPDSPITLESSSVVSPSITGDASTIYVVYRKSSETYIRTKYSTNGGSSWNYLTNLNNANASFIESIYSEDKLHVTYQVSNSVYYSNYVSSWSTPYTVSNTENGSLPRITAWNGNGEDKVYFLYRNTTTVSKWREYNVTSNSWGSIQTAFSVSTSYPAGFTVDDSYISLYYSYYSSPYYYFDWVVRNKSNNNVVSNCTGEKNQTYKVYSTTTVDEEVHIPFWYAYVWDEEFEPGLYRSKGGCTLDNIYWNASQNAVYQILNVSSSSNDVYVIWQDNLGNSSGDNLRLIYEDADPLQPQGLDVESYEVENQTYPKLTWTFNNEPDVRANNDGYLIERRTKPYGGSWSSWSQIATVGGSTNQYVDYDITNIGADRYTA